MLIENNVLTVDGHTEELPRLATPGVVRVWKVPTEYRESGHFVSVQAAGKPMELPACAASEMQFVGEAELAPADDAALAQVKKEKLSRRCLPPATPPWPRFPRAIRSMRS